MSVVKYNEFSEEICVKTTEKEEINSKQQRGWLFNIYYGLYKNWHCLNHGSNKPIWVNQGHIIEWQYKRFIGTL